MKFSVESAIIPTGLQDLHNKHLQLQNRVGLSGVGSDLLEYWSAYLSIFLEQDAAQLYEGLSRLYTAYRSSNIECVLDVINDLKILPGYPFITETNFVQHMRYLRYYLGMIVEKDVPKVLFFAFQKTASSFVSVVLCNLLNIAPTMLSFDHIKPMPAWINAFGKWGGVTHDHYYPSPDNLKLLYDAGIKKCIIHHRHPMNVLVSFAFHFVDKHPDRERVQKLDENERLEMARGFLDKEMVSILKYYGSWWRLWQEEADACRMQILNTHYEDMKTDQVSFFTRIMDFYGLDCERANLQRILTKLRPKKNNKGFNYRKASSSEWREVLTLEQRTLAERLIEQEFPDLRTVNA